MNRSTIDYEGVDFLATAILTGISSWFGRLEEANQSLQPWYESFCRISTAAADATSHRTPTTFICHCNHQCHTRGHSADSQSGCTIDCFIDGDNEMEHNQHRVNNDSLAVLAVTSLTRTTPPTVWTLCKRTTMTREPGLRYGYCPQDRTEDADNSSSTSDDESYDCSRHVLMIVRRCSGIWVWTESWSRFRFNPRRRCTDGQISGAQSVPNAPPYPSLEVRRKAAEEWKVALDQRRRDFGEDHPDTVYAMDYLAYSHMDLASIGLSETWEDHPDTLRTMGNLAETCRRLGQYEKAEELETGLLEKRRQLLGEDHLDTLLTASNLAATYRGLGRFKEAESLHVQVLEKRKEILGENHPDTLLAMEILAATYLGLGQPKEAESLRIQVLEKWRRILGEDHPDTLKRCPKAAELGVVALEKQSKLLGEDHPHIIVTMANLAKRRKTLGNDHPDTIEAMHNLATTYRSLGKLQDAEQLEALLGDREV
ncbi:hypothetical protein B0H14DRAFT_3174148 [Mycena olivaceomarginata]|nr:hypothetical protein B0H14DRAFT_3174148 [Mycena olivaceomarginata]